MNLYVLEKWRPGKEKARQREHNIFSLLKALRHATVCIPCVYLIHASWVRYFPCFPLHTSILFFNYRSEFGIIIFSCQFSYPRNHCVLLIFYGFLLKWPLARSNFSIPLGLNIAIYFYLPFWKVNLVLWNISSWPMKV